MNIKLLSLCALFLSNAWAQTNVEKGKMLILMHNAQAVSQASDLCSDNCTVDQTVRIGETFFTFVYNEGPSIQNTAGVQVFRNRELEMSSNWGLDRINQPSLPLDSNENMGTNEGEGVDVYIIDSGIKTSHPEFQGRARHGINYNADGRTDDCNGHGTHVAGNVMSKAWGVAKRANAVAIRVFDCNGGGAFVSDIIKGISYAVSQSKAAGRRAVINMSLLGPQTPILDQAVEAAFRDNVVSVVAAGNYNEDACSYSPSGAPSAITVGATSITDTRPSFSNFGACVDIFAPGVNIESAGINSASTVLSGTSMAAPHVAGVVAQMLGENPSVPAHEIKDRLRSFAANDKLSGLRTGSPNALLQNLPPSICHPANEKNGHMYCDAVVSTRYYVCVWGTKYTMTTAPGTKCSQSSPNYISLQHI
jgi:subtilisin family serine protease